VVVVGGDLAVLQLLVCGVDFGYDAWVGKCQDYQDNSVEYMQDDIDDLKGGIQIAKGGKVVQDHSAMKQDMGASIFPRLRDVHAVFGDTGGALDFTDLVFVDDLWFGIGFLLLFLFWFHRIGLGEY
jgi:hypothetical protein